MTPDVKPQTTRNPITSKDWEAVASHLRAMAQSFTRPGAYLEAAAFCDAQAALCPPPECNHERLARSIVQRRGAQERRYDCADCGGTIIFRVKP